MAAKILSDYCGKQALDDHADWEDTIIESKSGGPLDEVLLKLSPKSWVLERETVRHEVDEC